MKLHTLLEGALISLIVLLLASSIASAGPAVKTGSDSYWRTATGNYYLPSGNIGIGTMNPETKLNIKSSVDGAQFRISDVSGNIAVNMESWDAGGGVIYAYDATGTSQTSVINGNPNGYSWFNNARVGIGTSTPTAKLSIFENSGTDFTFINITNPSLAGSAYSSFVMGNDHNAPLLQLRTSRLTGESEIGNPSPYALKFFTNGVSNTRMVITGTGDVGIGTTTPGEKLEVNGHIIGTPVAGRWEEGAVYSGAGYYVWDNELMNTDSSYLARADSNTAIQALKAGYYVVCANVLQAGTVSTRYDSFIYKNGVSYSGSLGVTTPDGYVEHSIIEVIYLNANDKIQIYASGGSRYGSTGSYWTTLSIYRLN